MGSNPTCSVKGIMEIYRDREKGFHASIVKGYNGCFVISYWGFDSL